MAESEGVIITGMLAICLDDRNQWDTAIFTLSYT